MGRRPAAAKQEERAYMPESSNPSLEIEESRYKMQTTSANLSSSRKKAKNQTVVVRQSVRLQNSVLRNHDIAPVTEELDASENEKEDEPQVDKKENLPGPVLGERNLEEKIDYISHLLETQQKILEKPKSKATKSSFFSQGPYEADDRYKSLYIESQEKIETLTEENYQLGKKLENALGQLEAYEKGTRVFSEVLDKLKDVILFSNAAKATETAINLSSRAIVGGVSSPDVVIEPRTSPTKRKRHAKERRRN